MMAGCSGDGGDGLQFCGVLPLLALSQAKLSSEEVMASRFVPPAVSPAEITTVEEVEVVREDPPPSLALSQAEALLQKVKARRTCLEEELAQINTQLADIISSNEELREEIKKTQERSKEDSLGHPQLLQTQRLRAGDLVKEIDQFQRGELKVLEEEVCDLRKAQYTTLEDLTSQTRLCEALLHCLRAKETQVYGEVWKLEDEATLLEGKGALWRQCEAASRKAGEEGRQRHQHTVAALQLVTQGFVEVTRRAEEVCVSLGPLHTLPQSSSPSHPLPQPPSPSQVSPSS
ncbi:uncharacterized protein LOC135092918 isoform X2 [Scylla paramamosain]|uniref:uncharacterized protein LOC135092918 isoform X2 n=1 Tax=Scylla paramamosain TaxID=85552 RepID=UPI0030832A6A